MFYDIAYIGGKRDQIVDQQNRMRVTSRGL